MITTDRPISKCCGARAKPDMVKGGWFCSKCVKACEVSDPKAKARQTLSTVRKPTGERSLFISLWAAQGGKCAVTGEKLYPPEHPLFHHQGSHGLNKGTYPDYRLDRRNVFMVLVEKHEEWHAFGDKKDLVKHDPRWAKIVEEVSTLKAEAHRKNSAHGKAEKPADNKG